MKFFAVHALFHVSAEIYYKKTAQNLRGFFTARGTWPLKITENATRGPRCVFREYLLVDLQRVALWSYGGRAGFLHT